MTKKLYLFLDTISAHIMAPCEKRMNKKRQEKLEPDIHQLCKYIQWVLYTYIEIYKREPHDKRKPHDVSFIKCVKFKSLISD